jgi:hypothetical protein
MKGTLAGSSGAKMTYIPKSLTRVIELYVPLLD